MLEFFSSGDGQRQLINVLKAVALHVPEVAYCQGMNYVAAALLVHFNTSSSSHLSCPQTSTFWMLIAWIQHYNMQDVWKAKMPGLSRCMYLYQQLLKKHFYELHAHLRNIGLPPSLLTTQVGLYSIIV